MERLKVGTMCQTQWIRAYLLAHLIYELFEPSFCASVPTTKVKHEGFCPNKLNSNLWVDAQSTCERECNVDEVVSFIQNIVTVFTQCHAASQLFAF